MGLIGYGYWGPNVARNLFSCPDVTLSHIADLDSKRLQAAGEAFRDVRFSCDPKDIINDPSVDALVITTPVETHFDLARSALRQGKHVLLSKPMTRTSPEAEQLINIAEQKRKVMMVDHTFLYCGAVRKIKHMVQSKELGDIHYYDSRRINLGIFRSDVSVLWDLAAHDLSILLYVLEKVPVKVSAVGAQPITHINYSLESLAYLTLMFEAQLFAHMHVSWLSPVKVRQTIIGGSNKMIVYNDLDLDSPVKIFDKGIEPNTAEETYDLLVQYRSGDMYAPKIDQKEPLRRIVEEFVAAIKGQRNPTSDGIFGWKVVKLLEGAEASLRRGTCVPVVL